MEYRGGSESAYTITITAEVVLSELIEDGPEAFATRVREMLEAELEPLLRLDWKKLRRPAQPACPAAPPSSEDRRTTLDVNPESSENVTVEQRR
jgi:hypothetical protein